MIAAVRLVEVTTAQQLVHAYETGLGLAVSAGADEPDPGDRLAATLPVWALAAGSVAAVGAAAHRVRAAHGLPTRPSALDPARVGAAFSSERLFRRGGDAPSIFAELSGFFRTADGWVRTHANYPHHREHLTHALGLSPSADAVQFATRVAAMPAAEVEDLATAAGAIAVRVRTESEWAGSLIGRAAAAGPLVAVDRRHPGELAPGSPTTWRPTAEHPLRGIRVLDLTRVLAGPVATRTLALLGADVLRVDPPQLPEIDWQFADTCQGKRSTLLDLRTDLATFEDLLSAADVLVTGYRPGALAAAGVRVTRPDLIDASVSAWGTAGPWARRRGFDSIVQAASGISLLEGTPDRPGALPAQALDHGSGYLLAAGVLDALLARADDGAGRDVRVSLARTASWLLAGDRTPTHPAAAAPDPAATVTHGELVTAAPVFAEYDDFRWPAPPYGSAQPFWTELPVQRP
ncbi:CoA transferase [Nocardia rhizosphaerihabitans]|uniref:L-carnitine dehydratase n=1 Tax=Nocardia rhizosphaerihabitans TaxID=1691570 RepID=A0ABQ2KDX1_9NOCA|nr:CoA transferase [Nocardia rhizosphaerihabitans]GGN79802.1 putative L-carnitine dehydratase [Nocardia rhizosphaerihabitans]